MVYSVDLILGYMFIPPTTYRGGVDIIYSMFNHFTNSLTISTISLIVLSNSMIKLK